MKETYYIFKEEDLKRVSGPVQNEGDKTAIFKQYLLDICKKVTVDDEKPNDADNFDACSMDVDEAMYLDQEFEKRRDQWLYDYNKKLSYDVTLPAIFSACFHGETWYKCPHCMNSFEFFEITYNKDAKTDETGVYICPKCKKRFKLL